MDETKETKQDSSPSEDTSAGSEGTTSKETKTFTEEDVEKLVSNRLAAKGRDAKSLETREAVVKAQEEANRTANLELERQRLDAQRRELESIDDPEAKKALLRTYDVEKREREHEEKVKRDKEAIERMFSDAETLAIEHNLKPSDLLSAANPEAMKLLAKNLALQRELDATKTKGQTSPDSTGFTPDSGTSDAAPSNFKQLEKNFINDPYKYGKAYKEALAKQGQ